MSDNSNNSNKEWIQHLLTVISTLGNKVNDHDKSINENRVEFLLSLSKLKEELSKEIESLAKAVLVLRVKAGIIGAFFGMVTSAIVITIIHILKEIIINYLK